LVIITPNGMLSNLGFTSGIRNVFRDAWIFCFHTKSQCLLKTCCYRD
jgi:hypothetical protein